jgi:hypothetical protein
MKHAMVLITYTPGPAARPELYEPWLREEDNPTFNRVAGIGEYSNWKLADPAMLGCTHFDFLGLASPGDLERVWFSAELDRFRAGWVQRWGYGAKGPAPVSAYATLFAGDAPIRARERFVEIELDPPASAAGERWTALEALRKHWAAGRAPGGEPWRKPIAEFNPLGYAAIGLRFHAERPARGFVAELIAAPPKGNG